MRRLILLVVAAIPCPAFADDPVVPGEILFPLKIGSAWTYHVSGQDERFVVKAVRQEMIGDQTCVLMEASLKDRVVATEHLAFTKQGLCRFREDKEDVDPPLCVLSTSASRKAWDAEYHLGARQAKASFSTTNEKVTVPFGKFSKTTLVHANANEGRTGGVSTFIWYAEGVGMVKQEIREGKRQPLILELEKFEKGGDK
jgi:hypothetical protein